MATREVVCLNETTPQLEVPQAADTYEMPRDVNITGDLTVTGTFPAPEGTAVLSTGEGGGSKFLREDGDNTCSWQVPAGGGDLLADGTTPLTGGWDVGAFTITALTFVSDQATGTAPFTVASTTQVANLNAATAGNAATVTTNANLTGHVTSTGNAAILGSFTVAQLSTALSDATISGNNSGDQSLTGYAQLAVAQEYTKTQNFNATTLSDAANISWDASSNQVCSVTLGGNRTLDNPTNMVDGATYILIVKQDGTGTRTLAYGTAYLWEGGTAPTLTTTLTTGVDILTFISDGTNMYGVAAQDFS